MKPCPSCGTNTMIHKAGAWVCVACGFQHDHISKSPRKSRGKRCLERIDRIGARLANVRW